LPVPGSVRAALRGESACRVTVITAPERPLDGVVSKIERTDPPPGGTLRYAPHAVFRVTVTGDDGSHGVLDITAGPRLGPPVTRGERVTLTVAKQALGHAALLAAADGTRAFVGAVDGRLRPPEWTIEALGPWRDPTEAHASLVVRLAIDEVEWEHTPDDVVVVADTPGGSWLAATGSDQPADRRVVNLLRAWLADGRHADGGPLPHPSLGRDDHGNPSRWPRGKLRIAARGQVPPAVREGVSATIADITPPFPLGPWAWRVNLSLHPGFFSAFLRAPPLTLEVRLPMGQPLPLQLGERVWVRGAARDALHREDSWEIRRQPGDHLLLLDGRDAFLHQVRDLRFAPGPLADRTAGKPGIAATNHHYAEVIRNGRSVTVDRDLREVPFFASRYAVTGHHTTWGKGTRPAGAADELRVAMALVPDVPETE
jgi:hypothetical protein